MDLADYAKKQRWWNRVFGQNSGPIAEKYSVATQIAIGGVTGWSVLLAFQNPVFWLADQWAPVTILQPLASFKKFTVNRYLMLSHGGTIHSTRLHWRGSGIMSRMKPKERSRHAALQHFGDLLNDFLQVVIVIILIIDKIQSPIIMTGRVLCLDLQWGMAGRTCILSML